MAERVDDALLARGQLLNSWGYSSPSPPATPIDAGELDRLRQQVADQNDRIARLEAAVRVLTAGQKQLAGREIVNAHRDGPVPAQSKRRTAG